MTETNDPTTETKAEKFHRITDMRLARILDDLRLLGNCGNASNYEYNGNDIHKLFSSIEKEMIRVRKLFNKPVPVPYSQLSTVATETTAEVA